MSQRVTLRKRQPYVTRGHKRRRIIRTPGGKYVYQHLKKLGTKPKCGDCGDPLQGVLARRPKELQRIAHHHKTVSRAYGGSRCACCVRQRVMRAFLIEEAKIVKKVIKEQTKAQKKSGQ
ncbi:60S ribosomal protein L34 [Tulasnella sp. 424]|nr:60S ribosomal protein L34 [Tulasnella sp. 424]KAG8966326.1 60S ribosomal protein L34 [Tulasnella sp. 425]